jgi:hypothetical protein
MERRIAEMLWLGGGNKFPTWAISVAHVNQDPTPSPLDIDPESAEALAALAETRQRIAEATATGLRKVAETINAPGGAEAVRLRIAEQYIREFGNIAKVGGV